MRRRYSRRMRIATRVLAALIATVATVALVGAAMPAQAAPAKKGDGITTVTVYHQAVTPTSVNGTGLGTVRTFFVPTAVNGTAADGQYLAATLTTVVEGMPGNQEVRASDLVFVFGRPEDQLVVGGVGLYPTAGATIAPGARIVRPVVGGSGRYAGAVGEAISTNLGANGWTHVFKIRIP